MSDCLLLMVPSGECCRGNDMRGRVEKKKGTVVRCLTIAQCSMLNACCFCLKQCAMDSFFYSVQKRYNHPAASGLSLTVLTDQSVLLML